MTATSNGSSKKQNRLFYISGFISSPPTSSMPGSSAPVFGDSSGDTCGIPSDNPNKDNYTVKITRPSSGPIENTTKYHSHGPKDNKSTKPSNILTEYPSGYPTGAPRTISNENPSSKHIF